VKIRQIAETIHSTFCRENCAGLPHFAVNGYGIVKSEIADPLAGQKINEAGGR